MLLDIALMTYWSFLISSVGYFSRISLVAYGRMSFFTLTPLSRALYCKIVADDSPPYLDVSLSIFSSQVWTSNYRKSQSSFLLCCDIWMLSESSILAIRYQNTKWPNRKDSTEQSSRNSLSCFLWMVSWQSLAFSKSSLFSSMAESSFCGSP